LDLGREGRLEDSARLTASLDLAQSRWPAIRDEAARVFPLPKTADGGALPPMAELVRLEGSVERGAKVFRSPQAACIQCHRVGEEGVDFGPALSGIGAKLARQALFESILDPSAGISFGYEAWSLELRNGDEVFGILASETAEELAVRQPSGVTVRIRKADLARRDPQRLSVMPAGLAQLLTRQELVDVVEYLASLKGPSGP
jgi:putative heme-binding domain-containing protein